MSSLLYVNYTSIRGYNKNKERKERGKKIFPARNTVHGLCFPDRALTDNTGIS